MEGRHQVPEALGAVCEFCGKTYDHLQIPARKSQHGLLYEEHAAALERAGRCVPCHLPLFRGQHGVQTEADEVYILGIARQAEPLD